MQGKIRALPRWLTIVTLLCLAAPALADSQVLFDSDSGDYIGGGQYTVYTSGISAASSGGNMSVQAGGYTMNFAVPDYVSGFAVGNYGSAERAAFRSPMRPGVDISGNGRGCNIVVGWFRVLQVQLDSSGNVQQLALDFKQNCEGMAAALYGAVRINSSLPLSDAGPFAIAGPPAEAMEGAQFSLDGGQSFERSGSALHYQWLQQSGPPVQLSGSTTAAPGFTVPAGLPLGGATLVFQLQVSDPSNATDTDTVSIQAHSKSDPQTYIDFTSQAGDFVGAGLNWHFDPSNTQFQYTANNTGAFINLDSDAFWTIDMTPASGQSFVVGAYENAQRYPFQGSGNGLSVYGDGRGCNILTGRFDVTQAVTDSSQNITRFGADFEQHCEGGTAALLGTVRYNYLDPHVPTALAGPSQNVTAGQNVVLDGSGSTDPLGTLVSYQWTQTQGPAVGLGGANTAKPSFTAPAVASPQTLVFQLLVKDDQGYQAAAVTQALDSPASISSSSGGSSSSSSSSSGGSGGGGGGAFGWPEAALLGLLAMRRRRRTRRA
jgi:hypothetical protein